MDLYSQLSAWNVFKSFLCINTKFVLKISEDIFCLFQEGEKRQSGIPVPSHFISVHGMNALEEQHSDDLYTTV